MAFTGGQFGPEAIVDAQGNALVGATVTVPNGYTATLDAHANLTVTGPASDSVAITVVAPGAVPVSTALTVRVEPLVSELNTKLATGGAVASVAGRTGVVVLTSADLTDAASLATAAALATTNSNVTANTTAISTETSRAQAAEALKAPLADYTVSAKGLSQGAATANNGARFGPDTAGTTTVGIQEAINAAVLAGGGRVFLFNGTYVLAADTNVGCSANVPASTPPANTVHLELVGESNSGPPPNFAGPPANGVVIQASPGGTRMVGIVDFYGAKIVPFVENISVVQPVTTTMWHGFDLTGVRNGGAARAKNCFAGQNTYVGSAPTTNGTGTAADRFNAGFKLGNAYFGVLEGCTSVGYKAGFRGSAQTTLIACGAGYCDTAYFIQDPTGTPGPYDHPIRFYNFTASACKYVINNSLTSGSIIAQMTGDISIEYQTGAGNFQFVTFLYDPASNIFGDIYLTGHASGGSTPNTTPIPLSTLNNNGGLNLNIRQVKTVTKPWLIDVNVYPTAVNQVGWDTITMDTGCIYGAYKSADSSAPTTNEIDFDVVLDPGTWTVRLMYVTSASAGIMSVQLDGTAIGTIDAYTAAVTKNVRSTISGVVVQTGGKHRLAIKVPTKNASATGYAGFLQHICLQRTA